jgi:hypothetical protein
MPIKAYPVSVKRPQIPSFSEVPQRSKREIFSPFGTALVEFLVERDQIVLKHREFDKQFWGKKSYQKEERFLFSFKHSMSVNSIPPCFP